MSTIVVNGQPPGDSASMAEHMAFWGEADKPGAMLDLPTPETKAEPKADEPTSAPVVETKEPARDADTGKFAKSGKPRNDPNERVRQATGETARERDRADAAERRAAELEARLNYVPPGEPSKPESIKPRIEPIQPLTAKPVAPKLADFPDWDSYEAARDTHAEAVADWKLAERDARAEQQRAESDARRRLTANAERFASAHEEFTDLDDVLKAGDAALEKARLQMPHVMKLAIISSEDGPAISHYLGTHPEILVQLARKYANTSSDAATAVQDALEARLMASAPPAAAVRPTGPAATGNPRPAAKPIEPVRPGRVAVSDSPPGDDASNAEHMAYWNRKDREASKQR